METVYLYGLVLGRSAHLVPAHVSGIGATVLRVVGCADGALGALVSTLDRLPRRTSLEDIRAHDHALQSVVHHGSTAAAVRFGQTFESDEEIRQHVGASHARMSRVLEDFDGCVEMRLLLPETPAQEAEGRVDAEEPGPGRAYLEGLRAAGKRAKGLGLQGALGSVVRAERVEEIPSSKSAVVFSHLVRRTDEAAYRDAVKALPALADAHVRGPLALYSFAEPE
ncbi:MAG: GvpL/GvpF family gas vesicle protein [Gemmatimonadaceae bacterium]